LAGPRRRAESGVAMRQALPRNLSSVDQGKVERLTVEGTTELLPFEVDSPSSDAWMRALTHAEARGRTLAAALDDQLGSVLGVEERPGRAGVPELRLAVTYALAAGPASPTSSIDGERMGGTDDVLNHVHDAVRPAYAAFRAQLLALDPTLRSSPAPLRDGRRRYEGFNRGGRNLIYAGFRRGGIRIQFELPDGHSASADEIVRNGTREYRVLMLTSATQVGGAIELARETLEAATR
jgi:hypothetical protein